MGETILYPNLDDNIVTSAKIAAGAVGTTDIADNAITGGKIALGSDAVGDTMYYNGTDYIRLAKGTAAQVLAMNAGATAPEWADAAGGMHTQVGSTVTASGQTTVDLTARFDNTYKSYLIQVRSAVGSDAQNMSVQVLLSGVAQSGNYRFHHRRGQSTTNTSYGESSNSGSFIGLNQYGTGNASTDSWNMDIRIYNPSSTSLYTLFDWNGVAFRSGQGHMAWISGAAAWMVTTAVTGIRFYGNTGNMAAGQYKVYGIA